MESRTHHYLDATSPIIRTPHREIAVRENENVTNLLSTGVNLLPNLVTSVEEHLKKAFCNVEFDNFSSKHCDMVFFARDFMWASFQMIRSVETCIRSCQSDHVTENDFRSHGCGCILSNE